MKKTKSLLVILTISFICFAKNDTNWVSLSSPQCKYAISQRTHKSLPNDFSIYKLSDSICLKIEAALPHILDSLNRRNQSMSLSSYKRQYFGLKANKCNFIYVNLFPNERGKIDRWKKDPVLVKDGGQGFCGLIIDLDKMQVVEIACNGDA
jgi:hypothetical protein